MCRIFEYGIVWHVFSTIQFCDICSQQCLQSCDLERHQKESRMDMHGQYWPRLSQSTFQFFNAPSCSSFSLTQWANLQHPRYQRVLLCSGKHGKTIWPTNPTKHTLQKRVSRSLTISDGLWRSLTISDDLMGFIRTYGASSCSCATSWSFSESRDPAFQTRAQLDADLCKCQCCDMLRPTLPSSTTAVNVFKHEMTQKWVSPLVTWWDSAMGFKQLALQYLESGSVKVWSARKNLLVHCGFSCVETCFAQVAKKNCLQLLHSSPCDLAIVPDASRCSFCQQPKTSDASCTLNPEQTGFHKKLHARRKEWHVLLHQTQQARSSSLQNWLCFCVAAFLQMCTGNIWERLISSLKLDCSDTEGHMVSSLINRILPYLIA